MDQNPLERITALPSVDVVKYLVITLASTVKYIELDTQLPVLTYRLNTITRPRHGNHFCF